VSAVAEAFGVRVAVASASVATAVLAVVIFLASRALRRIDTTSREASAADLDRQGIYGRENSPASAAG
jgi:hypothetical protein